MDRLTQLKHFVTSHNLSVEALSSFIQKIQLAVGTDHWFGLACFSYNIQFAQADATWYSVGLNIGLGTADCLI